MRRTQRDVHELFEAYCNAWRHTSLERMGRLEKHGWVQDVWLREYDDVVRMAPTTIGRRIVALYWGARCDGVHVFERYEGVPTLVESAVRGMDE